MITSLTIKNVASYNSAGETVSELKKVNYFFGNNGSGKSTLAKYLHSLSQNVPENRFNNCTQVGFDSDNNQIIVFNEEFIKRNFIARNTQIGIFSLNQKNEEIDEAIKEKQKELEQLENKNESLNFRKSKFAKFQEDELSTLKDNCFDLRKTVLNSFPKIKDLFPNKQKQNNFEQILKILQVQPLQNLTFDMLLEDYKKYYDTEIVYITHTISLDKLNIIVDIEKSINEILQKVIIGNTEVDISGLIDFLQNKKWVENGIDYLDKEKDIQSCPFCQQETIDKELIKKFNSYFDESYKKSIEDIEKFRIQYVNLYNEFKLNFQNVVNEYNELNKVSNLIEKLKDNFDTNIKIFDEKLEKTNEKKDIMSFLGFKQTILDINKEINTNNENYNNLDSHRKSFLNKIWLYITFKMKTTIETILNKEKKYQDIFSLIDHKKEVIKDKIIVIKGEIESLREQTISTKEAVENINTILKNSGFGSFSIEEKELTNNNISEYYLKRDSGEDEEVFKTLSEGEKNFIAFLYYYQLCLGVHDIDESEKRKILVIDDPVSSLDSQVLFIVNSLIQHLIANKGKTKPEKKAFKNPLLEQVFILTHNIYFHKEVSLFSHQRICIDHQFFTVKKVSGASKIQINEKPVVNDYFLLWDTLKNINDTIIKNPNDKTHNISITNLMRRILESYVNFTGLGNTVWNAIKDTNPEDPINIICNSLISELQDGSHKVSPLDEIYFTRVINEEPQKLFDVFKIIFDEIGKEHYLIMMGIENE